MPHFFITRFISRSLNKKLFVLSVEATGGSLTEPYSTFPPLAAPTLRITPPLGRESLPLPVGGAGWIHFCIVIMWAMNEPLIFILPEVTEIEILDHPSVGKLSNLDV